MDLEQLAIERFEVDWELIDLFEEMEADDD